MKKKILALLMGCLFIGVNAYAAGDLQVNGALGVGTAPPSTFKAELNTANTRGMKVSATMNQDGVVTADILHGMNMKADLSGTATGNAQGINLISNVSTTAATASGAAGANFILSLSSSSSGSTTVNETAAGKFNTLINAGNHNYSVTQGYGFNLSLSDNRYSGSGSLNFTNFKNINIENAANAYGALSVGTLSGVWIDKQTLGTTNYGIVLNGDGAGADIVFGASQQASIYSASGLLYAKDMNGNITQFSPHDPETGEWIYYSKNTKTGVVKQVNMEKLIKAVENLTGEKFMIETLAE